MSTWPTDKKLAKLRAAGKVPYSKFATSSAVLVSIAISVFLLKKQWNTFIVIREVETAALLFLAPPLCVLIVTLLVGLLQTKFFWRPALLSIQGERLSPFKVPSLARLSWGLLMHLAGWIAILIVGLFLIYLFSPAIMSLLNLNINDVVLWPWQGYTNFIPVLLIILGLLALGSWLWSRFRFMIAHRMTSEDLEKELRERE